MKRIVAVIMTFCLMGAVMPNIAGVTENSVITAGAVDDYTEGTYEQLTYKNYGDHIGISDCDESATIVVIPDEIEGLPVTSIEERAFEHYKNLISVNIPNTVTKIGNWSFNGCSGLTSIEIPDSVKTIGGMAFWKCNNLKSLKISNSITRIERDTFYYCSSLTSIEIPNSVTSIGAWAFEYCSSLMSIEIPESVISIEEKTFCNCSSLTSITIPDSVTSIGRGAFEICSNLKSITILNPNCDIYDNESTISNKYNSVGRFDSFNGTIYGYKNSTAQAYAEKYNYKFASLGKAPEKELSAGDINGDDKIDSTDASLILAEYSLLSTSTGEFTEAMKKSADINKDGLTDSADASLILVYYGYTSTGGTDNIEKFIGL